jgi:sterol desaturase/sphingolipid hydroxylase (fatty acid hydroxylase superfamily)
MPLSSVMAETARGERETTSVSFSKIHHSSQRKVILSLVMDFLSSLSFWQLLIGFSSGSIIAFLVTSLLASFLSGEWTGGKCTRAIVREQILQSLSAILLATPASAIFQYSLWQGFIGRIYFHIDEHGWIYLLTSFFLYTVMVDGLYFWSHRLMHTPWLYRNFHTVHHQFRPVTSFTTSALDAFDANIGAVLSVYLPSLLLPVHPIVIYGTLFLSFGWSLYLHNGLGMRMAFPGICDNAYHLAHHSTGRFNYGFYFTFWDAVCSTKKDV